MIGRIKGTLTEIDGNIGLVDTTGGLGYLVVLPSSLVASYIPPCAIHLYTHLHIREDAHTLYGFTDRESYHFFLYLLSVSGVGAKTAHSIVSLSKPDDIRHAVEQNDADFFARMPGLGKKTAMKIVIELAPKLKQEVTLHQMSQRGDDTVVIEALVSLGFKATHVRTILPQIPRDIDVEERIKKGLQLLSG